MAGPELSRRLGRALGSRPVDPTLRAQINEAAEKVETWEQLPPRVRQVVEELERQPTSLDLLDQPSRTNSG
jgi:hypothetical protein